MCQDPFRHCLSSWVPLVAPLISQVYVWQCVGNVYVCLQQRATKRDGPVQPIHYDPTVLGNLSCSLFHRPRIPKRSKREKNADGWPAITATLIYPITKSVYTDGRWCGVTTSSGPALVFDRACFTRLSLSVSLMASCESTEFHISIRERSGGFNIRFDREHK